MQGIGKQGSNPFKYNGKEEQDELDLGWMDYGARMYMPDLGRWGVVDKMADDIMRIDKSPYQYAWNNPVNLTDPDGNCPWCLGAIIGAAVDVAVQVVEISLDDSKTAKDFSFTSVVISAAAGVVGVGLAAKLKKASTLAKIAIEATSDAAASAGTQLAKDGEINVKDVAIDVIGGQTVGKVAGDAANSKFLKSGKGKRLLEQVNEQKNASLGKSNKISKPQADVEGAKNKLTREAAARAIGASTAASGGTSTAVSETRKILEDEE